MVLDQFDLERERKQVVCEVKVFNNLVSREPQSQCCGCMIIMSDCCSARREGEAYIVVFCEM